MTYQGRGAWTSIGGCLRYDSKLKKTVPGPYYMAPRNSPVMMGSKVASQLKAGTVPDLNEYVVFLAIKEYQKILNNITGSRLAIDGELGPLTDAIIKRMQTNMGVSADGEIGPLTTQAIVMPVLKASCRGVADWRLVAGLAKQESTFDIGAVGYYDSEDIGIVQINGGAHTLTIEQRVDLSFATRWSAGKLDGSIAIFNGSIRDAIASYNLGVAGTRAWIAAGRPAWYLPVGMTVLRNVKGYIDSVVYAFP